MKFDTFFVHEARCLLLWNTRGQMEAWTWSTFMMQHETAAWSEEIGTYDSDITKIKQNSISIENMLPFGETISFKCSFLLLCWPCFSTMNCGSQFGGWSLDVCRTCVFRQYLCRCQKFACGFCWNPEEPEVFSSGFHRTAWHHVHHNSNTISPPINVSYLQCFCSFLSEISSFSRCDLKIDFWLYNDLRLLSRFLLLVLKYELLSLVPDKASLHFSGTLTYSFTV